MGMKVPVYIREAIKECLMKGMPYKEIKIDMARYHARNVSNNTIASVKKEIKHLLEEGWALNKPRKTVCFDLDGCIATYSGWKGFDKIGRPIKATIEAMRELWNRGFYITIFTTRPDTPKMRKWLEKNDVPFHSINSNSHNPPTTSQKPIYHCMVDDRAVRYRGQNCYELLKDIAEVMKTDIF